MNATKSARGKAAPKPRRVPAKDAGRKGPTGVVGNGGRPGERTRSDGADVLARPLPETLGECVDLLYVTRQTRLDLEHQAQKFQSRETALREHIIEKFSKADIEGARGKVATCSVNHATVAQVTDWAAFMEYVGRERAFDLVQRRVNDTAYRSRLDERVSVPGLEPFKVLKLSVQKRAK